MGAERERGRRSRRRRVVAPLAATSAVVVALVALATTSALAATRSGLEGRRALVRAETELRDGRIEAARRHLRHARRSFGRMEAQTRRLGPLLVLARLTPLLRVQVRGAEALGETGSTLAEAGLSLADGADRLLHPRTDEAGATAAVNALRHVGEALGAAEGKLRSARTRLEPLSRYRLLGALGASHGDLAARLPRMQDRARSARDGVAALIAFAGGSGPRRYLLFSQNPDEVRPTGGFIGSYGLLRAGDEGLALEHYASIESWYLPRPHAVVPPPEAPTAFRFAGLRQTIANVNSTPDWPQAARRAAALWRQGGEEPVDGVVSFTPELLSRVLDVVGPVTVPGYEETVTAANLVERLDHHTHAEGVGSAMSPADRKHFLSALAGAVLRQALTAPASRWHPLARAISAGLDRREAMAWVTDGTVAAALAARGWDGAVPRTRGDFFLGAEFEYEAKNGRSLRRTYDHRVAIRRDGSARVETTVTIANTAPFRPGGRLNVDSSSYIVLYGAEGAALDPASDVPTALEEPIAGHPAAGWLRAAQPLSQTTLKVAWEVPRITTRRPGGAPEYRLRWMHVPGNSGDVLRLRVDLPPGWRWAGRPPPATVALRDDLAGSWALRTGGR